MLVSFSHRIGGRLRHDGEISSTGGGHTANASLAASVWQAESSLEGLTYTLSAGGRQRPKRLGGRGFQRVTHRLWPADTGETCVCVHVLLSLPPLLGGTSEPFLPHPPDCLA